MGLTEHVQQTFAFCSSWHGFSSACTFNNGSAQAQAAYLSSGYPCTLLYLLIQMKQSRCLFPFKEGNVLLKQQMILGTVKEKSLQRTSVLSMTW